MKLTLLLLLVACCACARGGHAKLSTTQTMTKEEFLERAASQLSRLSAFRRTREPQRTIAVEQVATPNNQYETIAAQPQQPQQPQPQTDDVAEAQKRIDELRATATQLLEDPRYQAMMQDRIKRSFIGGIANKLVGGVVGAASGASRGIAGLSSSNTPEYGYGHSYQSKFDIGDFAKAIINTLIQAIKAIGGGAIAGGGALVKGGGFLVSAKGQIISSAGSAIASLGKSIASSAIIAGPPKPVYGHPGYSYDHPTHPQGPSHDPTYDGPPPSADAYAGPEDGYNAGHSSYAAPSNDDGEDDDHAGLLVVKETKPGQGHGDDDDDHPPASPGHSSGPSLAALEESFGGPPNGPSSTITKITGFLNSGAPIVSDDDHREEQHVDHHPDHSSDHQPPTSPGYQSSHSSYDAPPPQHDNGHYGNADYQSGYQSGQNSGQNYDSYGTKVPPYSSQLPGDNTDLGTGHHQDYQSFHQQIQETIDTHLQVPRLREPTVFKDLSSFADYHHHSNGQQSEPLKIPILGGHPNSLDNSHDHGQQASFNNHGLPSYSPIGLEISIGGGSQQQQQQQPLGFDNYQLPISSSGFDRHIRHPMPPIATSPAILGLWKRFGRRRSVGPIDKSAKIGRGPEIRRAIGYSLTNARLTRI